MNEENLQIPDQLSWREKMTEFDKEMLERWNDPQSYGESYAPFEYNKQGFDLEIALDKTKGSWIDIGGPSTDMSCFGLDIEKRREVYSVNTSIHPYPNSPLVTDVLVADKATLPFEDGSVGAVFMYGFYPINLDGIAGDIYRILEADGLWYTSVAYGENVDVMEQIGFEVVKIGNIDESEPGNMFAVVLRKKQ